MGTSCFGRGCDYVTRLLLGRVLCECVTVSVPEFLNKGLDQSHVTDDEVTIFELALCGCVCA